jgi:hypothetical protein
MSNPDFDKVVARPVPETILRRREEVDRNGAGAYYGFHGGSAPVAWEQLTQADRVRWRMAGDAVVMLASLILPGSGKYEPGPPVKGLEGGPAERPGEADNPGG